MAKIEENLEQKRLHERLRTLTENTYWIRVISENTNIYCIDSTHKTAKDIAPIEEGSKIHNSVYLFRLLVKGKDVHQGSPVAFMACKPESRTTEAEPHAIGSVLSEVRIHYCDFHVGQLWEKQLSQVTRATANTWARFKELYSAASLVINYIQKNWSNKEGRLEKWAFFHREISIQSFDPDTPDTYYILVVIARSEQLLSCLCLDFTKRKPLPYKHFFLAERVFHDLWLSRFLRPSVSADILEDRTVDSNNGPNNSANDDTKDTGEYETVRKEE
ncbi:hypothetical protein BGZ47_000340 [Haplosporangium gracile]|nr:hypothetical protein BGZ47_000340 [Haplosporangium gracile]